jgi:hypothetical protein
MPAPELIKAADGSEVLPAVPVVVVKFGPVPFRFADVEADLRQRVRDALLLRLGGTEVAGIPP